MKKRLLNLVIVIFFFLISSCFAAETSDSQSVQEANKIELREEESKTIPAKNITRHLSINPDIAITREVSPDILLVTGLKKGLTFIHIWDDEGRRTVKVVVEEKTKEKTIFIPAIKDTASKIELQIGETRLISGKNIVRHLSINPGIAIAKRISKETLSVTGVEFGSTFIHIWDDEGRRTISVAVRRKGFLRARERKEKLPGELKPFKFSYYSDMSRISVKSDFPENEYVDSRFSHDLSLRGESPWGMIDSRVQFRGRDDRVSRRDEDVTFFNLNLKNEDLEFTLGDKRINFSSLTLPYVRYQGVNLKTSLTEKLDYNIVWGAEGQRLYGNRVIDQSLPNPYFSGLRTNFHPIEKLDINTTFLRGKDSGDTISEEVLAAGYNLDLGKLNLRSEYAFGEGNKAWEAELRVNLHKIGFGAIYRDYDSEYKTVIGSPGNRGHKGSYLSFFHNPYGFIGISAYYDRFRDRFSPNPSEPEQDNVNVTLNLRLSPTPITSLYLSVWERDRGGVSSPTNSEGVTGRVSHRFDLGIRTIYTYLQYASREFKSDPAPSIDFEDERLTIGLRMNLVKKLRLSLVQEWNRRRELQDGIETTPQRSVIGLSYNSKIGQTPFYTTLAVRYEDKRDVGSSARLFTEEDTISIDAKIRYKPSRDFEFFVKGRIDDVRGTSASQRDRIKREIFTGVKCSWDTGFRIQPKGTISGVVFKDLNGNGVKDKNEPGLPNVRILIDKKLSVITDKEGRYNFLNVKGLKASVLMDLKTTPAGYIVTTANPQKVLIKSGEISRADFGITIKTQINGIVFNDLNGNKEFDDEDIGMKNILITVDSKAAITDLSGYYAIKDILPGEHTITLNTTALPRNYIPLVPPSKKIEVPEGRTYRYNFPVQALRTVMGVVFYDQNGNGDFDKGEKGIPDIKIYMDSKITLTDGEGGYIFKNLSAEVNQVSMDEGTLPPQYYLTTPESYTIHLSVEGEVRKDVNFGVQKR